MPPHLRATIAAAAHAFVGRGKVAGVYDHHAGRHLRIAAEAQGEHLQGYDGERGIRFGGTLPELYDAGDQVFVATQVEGATVRGYDRGSSSAYIAQVTGRQVQLFDHGEGAWFAFDVQVA